MMFGQSGVKRGADALGAALERSCVVAQQEGVAAAEAIARGHHEIEVLSQNTGKLIRAVRGAGVAFENARVHLSKLAQGLESGARARLVEANIRNKVLQDRARTFTVALFGRTMAGKSTIREALTRGDGFTIGKGAQNTTRYTHEYEWNRLAVLDAPGIASSDESVREALDAEARRAFERADVVLFLLSSDGIQPEVLAGLAAVLDRAKPILFVLNYKLDLTKPVFQRRFLADGGLEALRIREDIAGHVARLTKYAVDDLGLRKQEVRVVPIHAQAAFLGRHGDTAEERALHAASRIDAVKDALVQQVIDFGSVRRAQTMLDTASYELGQTAEFLGVEAQELRRRAKYIQKKFGELDGWLQGFIATTKSGIKNEAQVMVIPLKKQVSSFVDDNIERPDVANRWKRVVENHGLPAKVRIWQEHVRAELTSHLEEFARQVDIEANLGVAAFSSLEQYDPIDIKRGLGWISAGAAATTGVLIAGAALNFWNPAGWVMGALGVLSLGTALLSWFSDSREEKLVAQRAKAADQLRDAADRMAGPIEAQMHGWFDEHITKGIALALREETYTTCEGMLRIADQLDNVARSLASAVESLDMRLIRSAISFMGGEIAPTRIARFPGFASKVLCSQLVDGRVRRDAGRALGEQLDIIVDGDLRDVVARALMPARVSSSDVNTGQRAIRVTAASDQIGAALGRKGINVRLASKLLGRVIKVEIQRGRKHG